jgi:hypothetical protein
MDSIFFHCFAVLQEPTKEDTKNYEVLARIHIDQYFKMLEDRKEMSSQDIDLIGQRDSWRNQIQAPRGEILEPLAIEFFQKLLDNFHQFQDQCSSKYSDECDILPQGLDFQTLYTNTIEKYDLFP